MKATLFFETRPTDQARGRINTSSDGHKTKKLAAGNIENHLDLRLGTPWNISSNDTAITSTFENKQHESLQEGADAPNTLTFGLKKFKLASPTCAATALVSVIAAAAAATEECLIDARAMPSGLIHPWSLAARQQKAAFEKAYQEPKSPSMSRVTHPLISPPTIVWPPVRKFRKNLLIKSRMAHENGANQIAQGIQGANVVPAQRNPMFVKVNMEGLAVGRKINISLFNDYDSFFQTMQKLFHNFLTAYIESIDEEDAQEDISDEFFVLYDDNEGDRLLVGDVPWDVFVASVKRLIIMHSQKEEANGSVGEANE